MARKINLNNLPHRGISSTLRQELSVLNEGEAVLVSGVTNKGSLRGVVSSISMSLGKPFVCKTIKGDMIVVRTTTIGGLNKAIKELEDVK